MKKLPAHKRQGRHCKANEVHTCLIRDPGSYIGKHRVDPPGYKSCWQLYGGKRFYTNLVMIPAGREAA